MIYIDEHINDFDLQAALTGISKQRREQALQFRFEQGQRTCVLAYLLLKKALHEEYGLTENPLFEYGDHGKPYIVGHPEIHFNLSHCREAVACVVASHPVGIDVESIRKHEDSLVRFTMNEQEVAQIAAAERPDAAFIRLWTMKEARLKLSGIGITNDVKSALADAANLKFTTVERLDRNFIYTVCESDSKNQ